MVIGDIWTTPVSSRRRRCEAALFVHLDVTDPALWDHAVGRRG